MCLGSSCRLGAINCHQKPIRCVWAPLVALHGAINCHQKAIHGTHLRSRAAPQIGGCKDGRIDVLYAELNQIGFDPLP